MLDMEMSVNTLFLFHTLNYLCIGHIKGEADSK